jgi:hypothetical protein
MDRSSTKSQWSRYYDSAFWRRRRKLQMKHQPLCQMCLTRGLVTPAKVADHIEPHNGSWTKFRLGALQSLCFDCHDRRKRIIELRGYDLDVDDDGWPTSPEHPANKICR